MHADPVPVHVDPIPMHADPVPMHADPIPMHVDPIPVDVVETVGPHGWSSIHKRRRPNDWLAGWLTQHQLYEHVVGDEFIALSVC